MDEDDNHKLRLEKADIYILLYIAIAKVIEKSNKLKKKWKKLLQDVCSRLQYITGKYVNCKN